MSFTFNTAIPAANNNPSVDQPDMLTNNVSTDAILAVDHVSFNTSSGGTHKQVTLSSKNAAGAQTDPASTLYTGSGTASSVAQLFFRNQNAVLPISTTRAWGYAGTAGVIASQSVNVVSATKISAGVYEIVMTANATSSVNYAILSTSTIGVGSSGLVANYAITNTTTFRIVFRDINTLLGADPVSFSFMVLQL